MDDDKNKTHNPLPPLPQPSPTRGEECSAALYVPPPSGGQAPALQAKQEGGTWQALSLAWEMGYTIAVPLVVFALGGRWLDHKLGTSPWVLLTGVIISIPISTMVIYLKIAKIIGKKE